MTPKEKAKELVEKMAIHHWVDGVCKYEEAKQCALIALDEMMELYTSAFNAMGFEKHVAKYAQSAYLQKIKKEIEKL